MRAMVLAGLLAWGVAGSAAACGASAQTPSPTSEAQGQPPMTAGEKMDAKITVSVPAEAERSAGPLLLELTLKPVSLAPGEPFLVGIDLYHEGDDGSKRETAPLGTVAFFPPPQVGREQSFIVALPKASLAGLVGPVPFRVFLIPASAGQSLGATRVEVVGARFSS